ncbi:unnamed protein product, partial [Discosporangium mesarthrocarpum]
MHMQVIKPVTLQAPAPLLSADCFDAQPNFSTLTLTHAAPGHRRVHVQSSSIDQASLPDGVPRLVVACCRTELPEEDHTTEIRGDIEAPAAAAPATSTVLKRAEAMCELLGIASPVTVCPKECTGVAGQDGLRQRMSKALLDDWDLAVPHAEVRRLRAERQQLVLSTVGITACGVLLLWGGVQAWQTLGPD